MTLRWNRLSALFARIRGRVVEPAGQTTAEYALVILGAAALATLLITWATNSNAVSGLFDKVIGKIL